MEAAAVQQPQPSSPPPANLLQSLVQLDTSWSLHLHMITAPVIPRPALKFLEISGDGRFWFPVAISLLLSPLSLHSHHLYSFFLCLLLGLLLDLLLIGLFKHLVRRPRPVYNKGMGLTFTVDHWSFPSGHSSRVFFVAVLFCLSLQQILAGFQILKLRKGEIVDAWLGKRDDLGNLLYCFALSLCLWALVTSTSRVLLGRHFVFDVLVGASLGLLEALAAFHFFRF